MGSNENQAGENQMTDQLQDLLQRVYQEGVQKAQAEAERIVKEAQAKADDTVSKAKTEAERIVNEAHTKAEELKKNSETDLKMAASHTLNSVKQQLVDVVLLKALDEPTKAGFSDPAFLKDVILATLDAWKANNAEGTIQISESMKGKLDEGFLSSLGSKLQGKLHVEFSPAMKQGFSLSPVDGSYKLSFTDEDFANLFKGYLRPRTAELLFSE
jgi:V/A-type H+-transporting ATPase subunit E